MQINGSFNRDFDPIVNKRTGFVSVFQFKMIEFNWQISERKPVSGCRHFQNYCQFWKVLPRP